MRIIGLILYWFWQWTWGFLQTFIGFIFFLANKKKRYEIINHRFSCCTLHKEAWGGVSLGAFIFCSSVKGDEKTREYIIHEYGHTVQSLILGPLYLFVIGIPSFILCNSKTVRAKWETGGRGYHDFYTERWADRLGGK